MYSTSSLRSNMPDRQAKPMSTVPPSPPWPTTRMSVRPLAFSAAATPVATAGALPNSECSHAIRQDVSGYGVENTSRQPVALTAITWPAAARLAAALAGAVAAGQRVGAVGVGLDRAQFEVQQPVADRETAGLVELDLLHWHRTHSPSADAGRDGADVAQDVLGGRPGTQVR